MIRLGLCCIFKNEPIKFKRTTAKHQLKFDRKQQMKNLSFICLHYSETLLQALEYCRDDKIGDFRINSQIYTPKDRYLFAGIWEYL